jgi:phosphotransacetylase
MTKLFPEIQQRAGRLKPQRCVVSFATDEALLKALTIVKNKGLITEPIFIGPRKLPGMHDFRQATSIQISALMAHECHLHQEADLIIQGSEKRQHFITSHLEGGVLDKRAVYLAAFYDSNRKQTFFAIDPLVAVTPTLENRIKQLETVTPFLKHIFKRKVYATALAPIETINPKLPATITAAVLAQMSVRHQFGKFLQITGPLDIDCALSKVAAQRKGVESKKSGNFDLYILPDTNSSYFFSTFLKYVGKVPTIGILLSKDRHLLLNSGPLTVSERVAEITLGLVAYNFPGK